MNAKKFFEETIQIIENMSDDEFEALLIESGIESCPDEETEFVRLAIGEWKDQYACKVNIQEGPKNIGVRIRNKRLAAKSNPEKAA